MKNIQAGDLIWNPWDSFDVLHHLSYEDDAQFGILRHCFGKAAKCSTTWKRPHEYRNLWCIIRNTNTPSIGKHVVILQLNISIQNPHENIEYLSSDDFIAC